MGAPTWKQGLTPESTLHEIVNMGGQTISLFKYEGKWKSGKTYSVEGYVVKDAETAYRSSGIFYGTVHRTNGRPTTRNCHEFKGSDLLEAMKEAIRGGVYWCWHVDDPKATSTLQNAVREGKYTWGSPSVEAVAIKRLEEAEYELEASKRRRA